MSAVWQLLETIPGPAAVPEVWKACLGAKFDVFQDSFLRQLPMPARSYQCPRECGCAHDIIKHSDGKIVAVCRCDPHNCDDIPLCDTDIVVLELNWAALGRAVAAALSLAVREADIGISGTLQIAVYGSDALPVVLVIQNDRDSFQRAVEALVARLHNRFMVITPTFDFIDVTVQQVLHGVDAKVVSLAMSVRVSDTGTLIAADVVDGPGGGKETGWGGLVIGEIFEPQTMLWNGKPFIIEEPAKCFNAYDLERQSLEDYYPDLREDPGISIKDVPLDEVENLRILRLVGHEKTLQIHVMLRDSGTEYPERLESSGVSDGWHDGGVALVNGQRFEVKGIRVETNDARVRARIEAARRARQPSATAVSLMPISAAPSVPSYMLRQGCGVWVFAVNGLEGSIIHMVGLHYVEYLFKNPPAEPIHAIDLQACVSEVEPGSGGIFEVVDPDTGERITLPRTARIQERNLSADDREANKIIWRIRSSWQVIADDESVTEMERNEARDELAKLDTILNSKALRDTSNAARTNDRIRQAINRLLKHLEAKTIKGGGKDPAYAALAEHIRLYLLKASKRYSGNRTSRTRTGTAQTFMYERPDGVIWSD